MGTTRTPDEERPERRRGERRHVGDGPAPLRGERRLREIIARLPDGIIVVDGAGAIRFANPAAEALFGRPAAELVGAPFGHAAVVGDTTEIDIVRRGGATVTAELRSVETEWEGAPMRLVALRDVTDRRHAEERARLLVREQAARAEAEAASQAKSEFLAMMSHELRTPLNAVLGYSELLELGLAGPLTDGQREQLGRIRLSGRHLLSLVNEVLDLAKVEAGRLAVRCTAAGAADALAAAIALTQPQAEARGVRLTAHQEGDAPLVYLADDERVRQILVNLIGNAIKFTEPGGRITITAGATETPDRESKLHGASRWVYLRVADTGIGIDESKIASIFDPFVQVDTGHTRARDGTGLGLTISRRLARLMGGDLTVRSTPGRGSTFTLWLPHAFEHRVGHLALEDADGTGGNDGLALVGLADLGEALLRDVEPLLDAVVARIRDDEGIPNARGLPYSLVADHLGTLIADIAETLVAIEESAGRPSPIVSDATIIQRLIAERHGTQRARFGWSEAALRREFALVRDEVERALRRSQRHGRGERAEQAVLIARRFLEQAELASVQALARALAGDDAV